MQTELTVRSARRVQWDPLVLLVLSVQLARPARMELMARSARRVRLGPSVLSVPQVRTELTEQSGRKVRWDQQVQPEPPALPDRTT